MYLLNYIVQNYIVHLLACLINCHKRSNDVHCKYLEETLHTNLNIAHCFLKSLACNTSYNISRISSYSSSHKINRHETWSHKHDYSTTTVIMPCCCVSLCVTGKHYCAFTYTNDAERCISTAAPSLRYKKI